MHIPSSNIHDRIVLHAQVKGLFGEKISELASIESLQVFTWRGSDYNLDRPNKCRNIVADIQGSLVSPECEAIMMVLALQDWTLQHDKAGWQEMYGPLFGDRKQNELKNALHDHPRINQKTLAVITGISPTTVQVRLDALEAIGFVTRTECVASKPRYTSITAAGLEFVQTIAETIDGLFYGNRQQSAGES
ncbi:MarR family winged helix-turn-helix transcriptional regulator [Asticcacaulis sp.]|uniref:MarR family winged helix-turn-helix transcriptional regulator n=1 Tax=Asticcacaulis sp. TaxID=1872648 RepID=UPI002B6D1716|nr:winged helix-turn-helix transcriptional regulator [Asticcacaulis sp.]HTM81906.1 winged helix-turn-helix transcriptional regulator [Asticcacaulis sp.]